MGLDPMKKIPESADCVYQQFKIIAAKVKSTLKSVSCRSCNCMSQKVSEAYDQEIPQSHTSPWNHKVETLEDSKGINNT